MTIKELLEQVNDNVNDWYSLVLISKGGIELDLNIDAFGSRLLRVLCQKPNKKLCSLYLQYDADKAWHDELINKLKLTPSARCWSLSPKTLENIDYWLHEVKEEREQLKAYCEEDNDEEEDS